MPRRYSPPEGQIVQAFNFALDPTHQRDDNAAINLARWASLGSVRAPVKRGAEHQTGSHSAAGDDTRKESPTLVGPNNSVRSAA